MQDENESCSGDRSGIREKREGKGEEESSEPLFKPRHLVGLHLPRVTPVWETHPLPWWRPLPFLCTRSGSSNSSHNTCLPAGTRGGVHMAIWDPCSQQRDEIVCFFLLSAAAGHTTIWDEAGS